MVDEAPVLTRPLGRRQLIGLDIVVGGAYALVLLTLAIGEGTRAGAGRAVPEWAAAAIGAAMIVPLAVRRLWPVPALVVSLAGSLLGLVLGVVHDDFAGAGYVLYVVAASDRSLPREPTLFIATIAAAAIGLLVVAGGTLPAPVDVGSLLAAVVVLAGSWTIGRAVRERRRFAERSAAQRAARAVADARLAIARDLHDVVAHGLSLIVVKAATANHVADERPEEARDALRVIEATGRDALREMRSLLDLLRAEAVATGSAELGPAPSLDQLPALIERISQAGVRVDLEVAGADGLSAGVGLTVYRVVQEALTNVVRHAAPAVCRVRIAEAGGMIRVEIEDDGARVGRGPEAGRAGHGLTGMRERVRALGGDFDAGPLPDRGFRVVACIPHGSEDPVAGATG